MFIKKGSTSQASRRDFEEFVKKADPWVDISRLRI
jgi:hypothetical protein